MSESTPHRSFFLLSSNEQVKRLTSELEREVKQTLDNGLYVIYTNELCVTEDLHIHEYKNGRKQLVRIDMETGNENVVSELV